MLISLSIQNLILIESLTIYLEDGLTCFTGETGAGKSIILDALACALGGKANSKLMKDPSKNSIVCATFSMNDEIINILKEIGIEAQEEIILRRVIFPNSTSKAFINDINVSVSTLQKIGEAIIEICGQHDSKGLMDQSLHLDLLDQYSNIDSYKIKDAFSNYKKLKSELTELKLKLEKAEIEKGYLETVIEDLQNIDPKENEEEELAGRRKLLSEGSKIGKIIESVKSVLESSNTVSNLNALLYDLEKYEELFKEPIKLINSARIDLEEASFQIDKISNEMNYDPAIIEQVEERLYELRSTARKYQTLPSLLTEFLKQKIDELNSINNASETIEDLTKKVDLAKRQYIIIAEEASLIRAKNSKLLTSSINSELAQLKMEKAEIFIEYITNSSEEFWTSKGLNSIIFKIKTNPGQPFTPLAKTASGGELSRVMLAMKIALSNKRTQTTLIFDEIDTGISGSVSDAVGKKLSQLSKTCQVLVVTHQPQVAAYAKSHMLVMKNTASDSTSVDVKKQNIQERELEIARMLSGQKVSQESIAAAKQMIKSAA